MRGESPLLGFGAVLVMALCSGFAGQSLNCSLVRSEATVDSARKACSRRS